MSMSAEHSLHELVSYLKSSKKKDRTSGLGFVSSYLCQERIVAYLSECSSGCRKGICWDTLFSQVHSAVLGEADRSAAAVPRTLLETMGQAMRAVVSSAHGRIKAPTLVSAVLSAFESRDICLAVGRIYLDLASNFLFLTHYTPEISPKHWADLVDMCMEQYTRPHIKGTSFKFIVLLQKAVTTGMHYSLSAVTVVRLLPFLQQVLLSDLPDSSSFEMHLLQLVNTSLLILAADYRYKVADFIEAVDDRLIAMYKTGKQDVNGLLFQFFGLALNIHHPQGAGPDDPLVYASDWARWKTQMSDIHHLCETEVSEILRYGDKSIVAPCFLKLLVDVSYQLTLIRSTSKEASPEIVGTDGPSLGIGQKRKSTDTMMTQTQKRAKLINICSSIGTILSEMCPRDQWFWLTYLKVLIETRPSEVQKEYAQIVQIVCRLLCHVRDPPTTGPLARCAVLLLDLCPEELASNALIKGSWEKTSESLLRSVAKDNSPEHHLILQALILHSAVKNPSSVLDLFLNETIRVTGDSLSTLIHLLSTGIVKDEQRRCDLLRWCLCHIAHPLQISLLVLALTTNQTPVISKKSPGKPEHEPEYSAIYRALTLKDELVKSEAITVQPPLVYCTEPQGPVVQILLELLQDHTESAVRILKTPAVDSVSLERAVNVTEVILRILSPMWQIPGCLKLELLTMVRQLLLSLTTSDSILNGKVCFCIEHLCRFYALDIPTELQNALRDPLCIDPQLIPRLLARFQDLKRLKENQRQETQVWSVSSPYSELVRSLASSAGNPDMTAFSCPSSDKLILVILELFSHFITTPGRMNQTQTCLVMELLQAVNDGSLDIFSSHHLQVVLRIVHMVGSREEVEVEHLYACLEALTNVCQKRFADVSVLTVGVAVLRDFIPAISRLDDQSVIDQFTALMEGFLSVLAKREHVASGMVLEFIRTLMSLCRFPNLADLRWTGNGTRMIEGIMTYVSHSSVKVRLTAARAVENVFRLNSTDASWQEVAFKTLQSRINDIPWSGERYEKLALTASSLLALAHAFCSTVKVRLEVAYTIIQFIYLQDCDCDIVNCFLNLLADMLKVDDVSKYFKRHLRELLTKWLREGQSVCEFPHQILKCESVVSFYRQHIKVVGAACFLSQRLEMLDNVASKLKFPSAEILEQAYPIITALARGESLRELDQIISTDKADEIRSQCVPEIVFADLRESDGDSFLRTSSRHSFFTQLIEVSSTVQKILLLLEEDIVDSVAEEDMEKSFNSYAWFVKKYVDETETDASFTEMNCYVLRDAISVALRLLSNQPADFPLRGSCDLIKYVVEHYLSMLKSEIILLVPGVVNVLVSVASPNRDGIEPALSLLRFLVLEKRSELDSAIARLDSFPEEEHFVEFAAVEACGVGLQEEMERFNSVVAYKGRRVAGLTRLLRALETNKEDLRNLYEDARLMRGVSKGFSGCLLYDVTHQLVELCAHKDYAVRVEAAKCLGELGPADLSTLVMRREEMESAEFCPPEQRLVDQATLILGQLVQTEALVVKRAACEALYGILRCEGAQSQFSAFLLPFLTQSVSKLVLEARSPHGPPTTVWIPPAPVSHDEWVQTLTVALLETLWDGERVCALLAGVCRVHAHFAHQIFPTVLDLVVTKGPKSLLSDISCSVNQVLASYVSGGNTLCLKSISSVVEAVDYIRRWRYRSGLYDSLLDLDLLLVAEVAGNCSAHFTSMLYAELWFEEQKNAEYEVNPSLLCLGIDGVRERGDTLSRVMRSAFSRTGVPDGLLGCGSAHLADWGQRVAHLEQLGRWDMSLLMHDVTRNGSGIASSLHQCDLLHTLSHFPADPQMQLRCATKLGDWSFVASADADSSPSFHLHAFTAIKALHEGDTPKIVTEVNRATDVVLKHISDNKVESSRDLYQCLSQLQCLKQIRDFTDLKPDATVQHLRQKWRLQDLLKPSDFSLMEEVIATRCVMVKQQCATSERVEMLGEMYLRLCQLARHAKRDDIALRNVILLKEMKGVGEDLLLAGDMEEARYFWGKGEHTVGTFLLSQLLQKLENTSKKELNAECLRVYGNWMVETKAENSRGIINKYFGKSLNFATETANRLETFATIAKFADLNYSQLREYLDSPQFESRQDNMRQQTDMLTDLARSADLNKDRERLIALSLRTRESNIDKDEVSRVQREATFFLCLSVKFYLQSLHVGDKYNHFVFRLVSLWLNNMASEAVNEQLKKTLPEIACHKFICLLPQIVPRMSEDSLLSELVERTVRLHPYHSLPVLFALKNSHMDHLYSPEGRVPPVTSRINAALIMLNRAEQRPETAQHVREMTSFTEALIHFANADIGKGKAFGNIPQNFPIAKIENLQTVVVPSIELPVQPSCRYSNIIGVRKFSVTFRLVGGINAPKKVECIGTDGKNRYLLIKGKDDPRQDAVMQQVFGVINTLLERDEEASRRKLVMRSYRVVPLSQRSGVIEWCANTQPLGVYLIGENGSGGAHVRFRPNDIRPAEARKHMSDVARATHDTKLEVFLKICEKFRPVFHYFFLEKFPSAGVSFEQRLAYIRSVATSSMIGYILGLGDRHNMNILIDNATAEVIHIDFGIAFEQGKVLQTPETVPFRLTRDIVDGMGLCGVDGVFRACCERTMAVMRESKDTIVTLLEVLLYDPLYSWTISAKTMHSESSSNSTDSTSSTNSGVNALAERALLRMKAKLQGMEEGGVVSKVEGQVSGLIQQARDPANLSRLFHGWQPHV